MTFINDSYKLRNIINMIALNLILENNSTILFAARVLTYYSNRLSLQLVLNTIFIKNKFKYD